MTTAIPMSLLLDVLRSLNECAQIPRGDDDYGRRLDVAGRAHSAAFRLSLALGQSPDVPVTDNREQVKA